MKVCDLVAFLSDYCDEDDDVSIEVDGELHSIRSIGFCAENTRKIFLSNIGVSYNEKTVACNNDVSHNLFG